MTNAKTTLIQKSTICLLAALLAPKGATGTTISASSGTNSGVVEYPVTEPGTDAGYVAHIHLYADPGRSAISEYESCVTISAAYVTVSKRGWSFEFSNGWGKSTGSGSVESRNLGLHAANITNNCGARINAYIFGTVKDVNGTEIGAAGGNIYFDTPRTCSVSVKTDIIPPSPLSYGETPSDMLVSNSGSGNGSLTFAPNNYNDTSGLLVNDNSENIAYEITGTKWDSTKHIWTGDLSTHSIHFKPITSTTPAGTYSGIVTATIGCE